eukprot:m.40971 g.40971  ORF g.40971 m.40971 type:complete len:568 (+) comp10495_c0_seq1:57-1760(+)
MPQHHNSETYDLRTNSLPANLPTLPPVEAASSGHCTCFTRYMANPFEGQPPQSQKPQGVAFRIAATNAAAPPTNPFGSLTALTLPTRPKHRPQGLTVKIGGSAPTDRRSSDVAARKSPTCFLSTRTGSNDSSGSGTDHCSTRIPHPPSVPRGTTGHNTRHRTSHQFAKTSSPRGSSSSVDTTPRSEPAARHPHSPLLGGHGSPVTPSSATSSGHTPTSSSLVRSFSFGTEEHAAHANEPEVQRVVNRLFLGPDDEQGIPLRQSEILKERCLGRGAFGEVFLQRHVPTQATFATKFIRLGVEAELLRELKLSRQFCCPNIVRLCGLGIWEGEYQLFMELMDLSVDRLLADAAAINEQMPEAVLGRIMTSVVVGLDYMWEQCRAVHRDVKPSNILISARDNAVKLCDFGLAAIVENSVSMSHVGSALYLAPEVIKKLVEMDVPKPQQTDSAQKKRVAPDCRRDVWSVGLTAVELAQLHHPFAGRSNIFSVLELAARGPTPCIPSSYSPACQEFAAACLHREPKSRPFYRAQPGTSDDVTCPKPLMELEFFRKWVHDNTDVMAWAATLQS